MDRLPRPARVPRRALRVAVDAACAVLAAGFAAWAALRVGGFDAGYPLPQLIAFTPYVAGAAVPAALAVLVARRYTATRTATAAAVTVVAAALALGACVLPRAVGGPDVARGPTLRVMSANLRLGDADAAAVTALVRTGRVDLLALQEFTADAQHRLSAAGLDRLLPYRAVFPRGGPTGSALYARYPLTEATPRVLPGDFGQVAATLRRPGARPVRVESVHPCPPATAWRLPCWRAGLAAQLPARPRGELRLLAGDFNATLDHTGMRRLLDTGYRDAAARVGAGLTPTWPYLGQRLPPITLDHVLADPRFGVRSVRVHAVPGTDHRAVLVELTWPP